MSPTARHTHPDPRSARAAQLTKAERQTVSLPVGIGEDQWTALDQMPNDTLEPWSARLFTRVAMLLAADPYAALLSAQTCRSIAEVLTSAVTEPAPAAVIHDAAYDAARCLALSPMFSEVFLHRLAHLTHTAVWPQGDPGPERLWKHLREVHDMTVHIGNLAEIHAEYRCTWDPYQTSGGSTPDVQAG